MNKRTIPEADLLYSFTFTPHGHTTEEERHIYETIVMNTGVSKDSWSKASKIATLEMIRTAIKGETPDLNSMAWLLYEAGRIAGKQETL